MGKETKDTWTQVNSDEYSCSSGATLKREEGLSPNGNKFGGRWVLRNKYGDYIDHHQYRNDLACAHNLQLY